MKHRASEEDLAFRDRVESCELPAAEFDHRAHIRLAYVYLTASDTAVAHRSMRETLLRFIEHNGVEPSKYHETITRAWIMAVRHFMERSPAATSADALISIQPELLDSKIMLTHYSAGVLFSDEARARFVEPDRDPIPRYAE